MDHNVEVKSISDVDGPVLVVPLFELDGTVCWLFPEAVSFGGLQPGFSNSWGL